MSKHSVTIALRVRVFGWAWGQFDGGYERTIQVTETPTAQSAIELAEKLFTNADRTTHNLFPDFQRVSDCEIVAITSRRIVDEAKSMVRTETESVVLSPWFVKENAEMFDHD